MGVPAFFRWLSRKYPSVVSHCVEVTAVDDYGKRVPVNASDPNPNGVEFDNLYLDMNGIIHPCTHPEDRPAPKNEDEMMIAIFECIDRILDIVRPRKILYMAVDGVAPRAKMNQQRSRRFRASKEATEKAREIEKIRERLLSEGAHLPPIKENEAHFDSNCITPGTPFMARLSKCLHYYAHSRLNNHPTWKNIKVILSDANVPGEGEHKIMDFIRKQRGQPDHDPNTKHCLCGADADLIMLGLATHEPYFTIIREEFKPNAEKPCDICGKLGHEMKDCCGLDSSEEIPAKIVTETQYIFVRLNVLREYLARDLKMPELPFAYNFERVIDDWVFMCFFVGNDFLPHLPSLEIREGAIDRLIGLYKNCVYKTGGYLTEHGSVNLNRVQLIMSDLGVMEDEIFKKRHQTELNFKARDKMKRRQMKRFKQDSQPNRILSGQYAPLPVGRNVPVTPIANPRKEAYSQRVQNMHTNTLSNKDDVNNKKRTFNEVGNGNSESEEEEVHDEVRLYEAGFKDRYYESKFDVTSDNLEFRYKVGFEYVRGLCWVLHYYYQGCPSWKWFFPYHYAPFASDFVNIAASPIIFEKFTKPFNPLEQLMGVFPAASKSHVPEPWSKLMYDPDSPIIDFYPEDFKVDLNGKKFAWQGVALLPFAEEDRLFKALEPYYEQLTEDEKERNKLGDDRIYIPESNASYKFVFNLYENLSDYEIETTTVIDKVAGMILLAKDCVSHGGSLEPPINGLPPLVNSKVLCVRYRHINYPENHIYKSEKLPGAVDPPKLLKPEDLTREQSNSYRPIVGMARSTQRARIDIPGHRMLDFHSTSASVNTYQTVPPPVRYNQHSRGYNHNTPSYSNKSYAHGASDFGYNRNNLSQRSNVARGGSGGSHQYNYRDSNLHRQQRDDSTTGYQQQQRDNRNRSEDVPRRSIFSSTWANPSTLESDSRSNNRYQGKPSESYQKFDPHSRMGGPRPSYYSSQQNYNSNRQSNSRYGR